MNYLIDTNICIYIMNRKPPEVIQRFRSFSLGQIGISSVTVAELQYGVSKSRQSEKNQRHLNTFLAPFRILDFDEEAATVYGKIRSQLEQQGKTIGPLDMMIAAHALSLNTILVTNNEKEFKRVNNLQVENWVQSIES